MIRINNIKVPLEFDFENLKSNCSKILGINESLIKEINLAKKSIDARRKQDVHFIISVDIVTDNENAILKKCKDAIHTEKYIYKIHKMPESSDRPVIVGFGPAGMFAALVLAESGLRPIILERGSNVDERCKAVENFWSTGKLDENCNVQFGEGGAGTFSDGKLTTGTKDKRISFVLESFVRFGAPKEILYLAKPHIGTDNLCNIVKRLREHIISLGAEVHFNSKFTDFNTVNDKIESVVYYEGENKKVIKTNKLILSIGHSARDVFELLYEKKIQMSQKSFSIGMRIEHLKEKIDNALYGDFAGHSSLKAADYKQVVHLKNGRSIYTFCMCPGGYIVAASSEKNRLAVNGMSCYARNADNSNSALLVGVSPDDFNNSHPLAGMYWQRDIEKKAFIAGGGNYNAPIILVGDFLNNKLSKELGNVKPSYRPGYKFAMPEEYLPDYVCNALREGIKSIGKKIDGFDCDDAVLTGIESRSSSPVRIERNNVNLQSLSVDGIYPCGEGAGYAGGIVSAAIDGIKCAEAVIESVSDKSEN